MKNLYIKPQLQVIEIISSATMLSFASNGGLMTVDSESLLDSDDEVGAKEGGDDSWE